MTSPSALEENPRVIDIWGFAQRLWGEKFIWLGVFAVVFVAGAVYAMTRPAVYDTTQVIIVNLPPIDSTAEAIQQTDALTVATPVLARAMLRPPITDPVLENHPDIPSAEALQAQVTAVPIGNTIEVKARGNDPAASAQLVSELSTSFSEQLPVLTEGNPPTLRYVAEVWGDPVTVTGSSGRAFLMVAAAALATLVATVVAVALGSRRQR